MTALCGKILNANAKKCGEIVMETTQMLWVKFVCLSNLHSQHKSLQYEQVMLTAKINPDCP